MPVTVQCFHCSAILELDDGFRGGVCRCSSCGSLLQVPRGDDSAPLARKVRPAMPPSPTSPTSPLQNATSSKLDVGLSRGQFAPPPNSPLGASDSPSSPRLRRDLGISSGLTAGRIHQTTPIAAPPAKPKRHRPPTPNATAAPPAELPIALPAPPPRTGVLFWLGLLLAVIITGVLASLIIYYVYYYEPPYPPIH